MLDAISTNLTSFFREEKHFDFLQQIVLPDYAASKIANGSHELRFWSAGCSSGEEAYSTAILLMEHFGEDSNCDIKILGTDISTKVLEQAKGGVYPAAKLEKIQTSLARKYFHRGYGSQEGYFKVKPLLRDMVRFKRLNLIEPFPFEDAFDVILCRNVMIYFDERTQEALANKLYDVLLDGGYLFIGHSETFTRISHRFKYIKPSVYQKL
jgi:chemotaxis protein methyltransferase CheR